MSSRPEPGRRRRSSKTVDLSADWSGWALDEQSGQYYRTRKNTLGEYIYEWSEGGTAASTSASDNIPRSNTVPVALSPYASSTNSSDYGSEYAYQGNQTVPSSVDTLTNTFAGTSLDPRGRQSVTLPTSYGETVSGPYSATPVAQAGDNAQQPVPIRSSLPQPDNYGYDQPCTMSTPLGDNMSSFYNGRVAMASGYNASVGAGGYANTSNSPAYVSYGKGATPITSTGITTGSGWNTVQSGPNPTIPYQSFAITTDQPAGTQQGEASGSGAITPTATNRIRGVAGARKGDEERLDPRFKVHSSKHFKVFQVFKVLWSQPMGETANSSTTDVTKFTLGKTKYGQKVHSSIRRFVVVTEDNGHCLCLAISTYQHKGMSKPGLKHKDHAIIYTKDRPPADEANLDKDPIEVLPKTPRDTLDAGSLINYAKIYTVEHNVKVHFVGHIAPSSQRRFMFDYDATWKSKRYSSYVAEE